MNNELCNEQGSRCVVRMRTTSKQIKNEAEQRASDLHTVFLCRGAFAVVFRGTIKRETQTRRYQRYELILVLHENGRLMHCRAP